MSDKTIDNTVPGSDEQTKSPESNVRNPILYLAFQCNRPLASSARYSLRQVRFLQIGRGRERALAPVPGQQGLSLRIFDSWASSDHARLSDSLGRWVLEDSGSKNGTFVNGVRVKRVLLSDGDLIEIGHTFFVFRLAPGGWGDQPIELESSQLAPKAAGLATLVPALNRQFEALEQIARSDVSVVIRGESGTGKELMARATHTLSGRPGPFVAVNCGAIPGELVASELFGHQRGAFSGAVQSRQGMVRAADHGTLFLDEVGDLPTAMQTSFLRVLQERQVVPVGDTRPIDVDIRLCAATHRDLDAMVAQKKLREDLFARLSGFTLNLPPLRQRREDLGILISAVLQRVAAARAEQITFHRKAARALCLYHWPLNIRELEKSLEAAAVLAKDGEITLDLLPEAIRVRTQAPPKAVAASQTTEETDLSSKDRQLKDKLVRLLHEHRGSLSAVARAMKKDRIQVRRWLKRFHVNVDEYRSDDMGA